MTRPLQVLIACEFSGAVRDAFRARGHEAWSCDLEPGLVPSPFHIQGDVRSLLDSRWDLLIGHPPCTYLCNSGVRWLRPKGQVCPEREALLHAAAEFYLELWRAPIPHIALENPVMHGRAKALVGWPHQIVQPWWFGHGETKATGLKLKALPRLRATNVVPGRSQRIFELSPGPDRAKLRAITPAGLADAMAAQWSTHILTKLGE